MSLILEALRKSEAERRRNDAPNVYAELPPSPRVGQGTIPPWAWMVIAIVAILGVWWTMIRHSAPPTPSTASATAPAPITTRPRPTTTALPPVRRLSPPPAPAVVARAPAAVVTPNPIALPAPGITAPTTVPSPRSTPAPSVASIARGEYNGTMQLSDLSIEERKALPPLKLSMHMWNDDPARRFVILDGKRLGEGDRIGDAVVTAITSDGIVLGWNGRRIKLPTH